MIFEKNPMAKAFILLGILLFLFVVYSKAMLSDFWHVPAAVCINGIYIGLLLYWRQFIRVYFSQKEMKRYGLWGVYIMIAWFAVCILRDTVFLDNPELFRLSFYIFAIPFTFIPVLSLFKSFCAGKHEDYVLPSYLHLLLLPPVVISVLSILNDRFQLVFRVETVPGSEEVIFHTGILFYVIILWYTLLESLKNYFYVKKSRSRQYTDLEYGLPFFLSIGFVVYTIVYFTQHLYMSDRYFFFAIEYFYIEFLLYLCTMYLGNIPLNRDYEFAFDNSTLDMQILGPEGECIRKSKGAMPVSSEVFEELKKNGIYCEDTDEYHISENSGLSLVWRKDLSIIRSVTEILDRNREKLTDELSLQKQEYETKAAEQTIHEQNLLYDRITEQIKPQVQKMRELLDQAANVRKNRMDSADFPEEDRKCREPEDSFIRCIAKVNLIGVYVKRRSNFLLQREAGEYICTGDLLLCFREIQHALTAARIGCDFVLDEGAVLPDDDFTIRCLDLYEKQLEMAELSPDLIRIRLERQSGSLLFSVETVNGQETYEERIRE